PVALGTADADPLHLRELDVDRDAGHRLAIEPDGDELGLDAVLLRVEVRHLLDADVPRRRMHEQAGAVRDVLARDVLDVTLERVGVGQSVRRFLLYRHGQLAGRRARAV